MKRSLALRRFTQLNILSLQIAARYLYSWSVLVRPRVLIKKTSTTRTCVKKQFKYNLSSDKKCACFYSDEDIIECACRAHFCRGGFGKGFILFGILSLEQRNTAKSSNPFGLTGNRRHYFHCVIWRSDSVIGPVIHSRARL